MNPSPVFLGVLQELEKDTLWTAETGLPVEGGARKKLPFEREKRRSRTGSGNFPFSGFRGGRRGPQLLQPPHCMSAQKLPRQGSWLGFELIISLWLLP